jgi:FtsH-binding integral membrane protein
MSNDPRKTSLGWGNIAPPARAQPQEHARQPQPQPQWDPQQQQYVQPPGFSLEMPAYPPPGYPPQVPQFTPQPQQYVPPGYYQQQPPQPNPPQPYPPQSYELPDYLQTPASYPAAPQPLSGSYPQAYAYPHQYTPQAYAPTAAQQVPHAALPMPAKAASVAKGSSAARARMARGSERPEPGRSIPDADATVAGAERVRFVRLAYVHLFLAMLAFGGLLYLLMTQPFLVEKVSIPLVEFALGGRWSWGVVLGVFVVVSWLADYWARHASSRGVQYAGLAFYVVAEALIFVPLLAIVEWKTQAILSRGGAEPHVIRDSAYITLGIFSALTLSVFLMRKDFSFLRAGLMMATGAATTAVILSLVFGFNLGLIFSVGMVVLASAYILYQTSEVLAHYDPRQHVAASLALFSSVALVFWYVIRIVMRSRE